MKKAASVIAILATGILGLAGCASPGYPVASSYPSALAYQESYGVLESVRVVQGQGTRADGPGVGAIVGGLVGGLLGNQAGNGRGRTAATVAGVIGGAMVGNEIEQRNTRGSGELYQVGVRFDNGSYQTITQDNIAGLQVGGRVRFDGRQVTGY